MANGLVTLDSGVSSGALDASATMPDFNDSPWGTYGFATMMASGVISAMGDVSASRSQAGALQAQAGFTKFQAQENLQRGQIAGAQVKKQEESQLLQSGSHANQLIGAERASFGAQGVNVNAGVPLADQVATGKMSALDALTIRNNATLKAWGIETETAQTAGQQELEATGQEAEATQSLALGGAKAANALMGEVDTYESMRARGW